MNTNKKQQAKGIISTLAEGVENETEKRELSEEAQVEKQWWCEDDNLRVKYCEQKSTPPTLYWINMESGQLTLLDESVFQSIRTATDWKKKQFAFIEPSDFFEEKLMLISEKIEKFYKVNIKLIL